MPQKNPVPASHPVCVYLRKPVTANAPSTSSSHSIPPLSTRRSLTVLHHPSLQSTLGHPSVPSSSRPALDCLRSLSLQPLIPASSCRFPVTLGPSQLFPSLPYFPSTFFCLRFLSHLFPAFAISLLGQSVPSPCYCSFGVRLPCPCPSE